ncbi:hypothetical protein EK904_001478 [Melospiza melodia maxima]|nr:hypothetical protein EK904_001478 [Melospiza melodia maxima]
MQPSLNPGGRQASDVVLLNHWSIRNYDVQRGDIVSLVSLYQVICLLADDEQSQYVGGPGSEWTAAWNVAEIAVVIWLVGKLSDPVTLPYNRMADCSVTVVLSKRKNDIQIRHHLLILDPGTLAAPCANLSLICKKEGLCLCSSDGTTVGEVTLEGGQNDTRMTVLGKNMKKKILNNKLGPEYTYYDLYSTFDKDKASNPRGGFVKKVYPIAVAPALGLTFPLPEEVCHPGPHHDCADIGSYQKEKAIFQPMQNHAMLMEFQRRQIYKNHDEDDIDPPMSKTRFTENANQLNIEKSKITIEIKEVDFFHQENDIAYNQGSLENIGSFRKMLPVRAWKSEVGECEELAGFGNRDTREARTEQIFEGDKLTAPCALTEM